MFKYKYKVSEFGGAVDLEKKIALYMAKPPLVMQGQVSCLQPPVRILPSRCVTDRATPLRNHRYLKGTFNGLVKLKVIQQRALS